MKNTFAALAFMASSALARPQVTSAAAPSAPTPSGCATSRSGTFQISVQNVTSSATKRDVEKRQLAGTLTLSLNNGVLKDQAGRDGYIASNFQFQFDSPPQAGAIYTSGFSVCSNNTLALGGSAIFYQCWSGSFYNLYDRHWAEQCSPIYLIAQNSGGLPVPSQISDGQPQVPTTVPAVSQPAVSQISDGQPQVPTGIVISQISDGQPQIPTANPPAPSSTRVLITQISDGQPQIPTPAPSAPAPTSVPAPSGPLISQISDGQPQVPVPTSVLATATLPRAPVGTGNYTVTGPSLPAQFPGAAATQSYGMGAVMAALLGLVAMI
ncbi:covalently-linked cell wall protein-like protein [Dendryphion nanum]|uniref:Covalently-linked cell wall protein-like protein n=1 Tax=Dendryphion nanum TaxID=256645 RepID=A0A9P9DD56_9PLEO|nr:covalently-linked cell wall protein-like protein [Dendryphion nanum]